MIAIPVFGYKSHISIDRRFGFIRESAVTSATEADGRQLKHVVSTGNTGSNVWADSAYRSKKNEKWLAGKMLNSQIHHRKPADKPMPITTVHANAKKSSIVQRWSMCLRTRRTVLDCSYARLAWRGLRRN